MSDLESVSVSSETLQVPSGAVCTLYEQLKQMIGSGKVTSGNVVTVVVNLMQLVDKYPDLSGHQKKGVILHVLNVVIDEQVDDDEQAGQLKLLVQMTLPTVIDTIVSVDKKELQIKVTKGLKKFCSCFSC